jgi:transcriptional regulator with XRE-family HTH domain
LKIVRLINNPRRAPMKHNKLNERAYLREWRLAKGLTQPELASRVGTVKSEISRLEKGSRRMTLDWMSSISRALGITVDDLMTVPPMGFGAVSPPPKSATELSVGSGRYQLGDVNIDIGGDDHAVMPITGDDWTGMFTPGDLLVFDTSKKGTAVPGIFVFGVGGDSLVRRVTPGPEGVTLSCSNPAYPPVPLSTAYKVLGRVVARLHRL